MSTNSMDGTLARQRETLLDLLYSAPTDPVNWSRFLQTITRATGSRSARMLVMDRQAECVLSSIKHNIDDSDHQKYIEHYVNACPWRPELKDKRPGRLHSSFLDFSCRQSTFYNTEFYNDWAKQQDIHHGVCGTVWQDENHTVQLLIQRTGGQGHYSRHETDLINELVMHVRRAVQLQAQVQVMKNKKQVLYHACETQAQPFAILDQHARVIYLSDGAQKLIERHPSLALRQQHLSCEDGHHQLLELLSDVIPTDKKPLIGAGGTFRLSNDLQLLISPLPAGTASQHLFQSLSRPAAILYFYESGSRLYIDQSLLVSLFNLTAAEARVAAAIAQGDNPQKIAERYQLSVHTVRSQLKQCLHKTACCSQSKLSSVILSSPAAHRSRRPAMQLS